MKFRRGVAVVAGLCALAWISTAAVGRISGEWGGEAGARGGGAAHAAGLSATLAAMMRDPLSIFAMRSPGERGLALLSSKPERTRAAAAEEPPTERVLSTVRERPPVASALDEFILPADELLGGDLMQLAALEPQPEVVPLGVLPPLVTPGGGFWGGGGDEPNPPPSVPTPVPEPATWSMMLLGFFTIGSLLRRRTAARARSEARSAA